MHHLELLLLVLVGALGVTVIARKLGWPAPLLVTAVAIGISLIPHFPTIEVEPEIILTVVLPPLLYSAALDISFQGFRESVAQINRLGIGLVVVTALVVGFVAYQLYPPMGLAAALLLGAVVAPPDAVSATSIGKKLGLPRKVMTLLAGESLINDAAALTLFTLFLTGVTDGIPSIGEGLWVFLVKVVVGVAVGLLFGFIANWLRMKLSDHQLSTAFNLILPFLLYIVAEEFGGSGVLAVVSAGLLMGYNSPRANYTTRLQEQPIWAAVDVVLETFVFALIGLQFSHIVRDLDQSSMDTGTGLVISLIVLAVVILIRPVFIFITYLPRSFPSVRKKREQWLRRAVQRQKQRAAEGKPVHQIARAPRFTWQQLAVVSWTGMRGVVTLAAAASIPLLTTAEQPFPGRDLIQFTAFVVTIGTLLIQGLTLPALIRVLHVSDPNQDRQDAKEERRLLAKTFAAAWDEVSEKNSQWLQDLPPEQAQRIERRVKEIESAHLHHAETDLEDAQEVAAAHKGSAASAMGGSAGARGAAASDVALAKKSKFAKRVKQASIMRKIRLELIAVRRRVLIEERDAGRLDEEIMRAVLQELDAEELALDSSWQSRMRA